MDLAQAKLTAQGEANNFVGDPKVKCPKKKTGLLVVVYRDDTNESIGDADVTAVKKKLIGKSTQSAKTDSSNGIAKFLPIESGNWSITVKPPQDATFFLPVASSVAPVASKTCPVQDVPVTVLSKPAIKVVVQKDNSPVAGVRLALAETHLLYPTTDKSGTSKYPPNTPGVRPGKYTVNPSFENLVTRYQVVASDGKPTQDRSIGPVKGLQEETFTLYVKPVTWVRFLVFQQLPNNKKRFLKDSIIKLTLPGASDPTQCTTTTVGEAIIQNLDPVTGTPEILVSGLEIPLEKPENQEVYEFVELKTG